jgi:IS605 OrfB family transposase
MSVKAIQAKVVCDTPEKLQYLWLTHRIFNEGVRFVLPFVFKMKRGDLGEDFQVVYEAIRGSQNSFAKLEPITDAKWKPRATSKAAGEPWQQAVARIRERGAMLFDRKKELPHLPSEFRRKIFEMTIQLMHGHDELVALWETEHRDWRARRAAWETEHADYMRMRPVFQQFEDSENVTVKGSRGRWLRYLDFLSAHPELARWRNPDAVLVPLTPEERRGLRRPKEHFDKFWAKNPELRELDKLHGYYQEEFARPWVEKKNPDGFKHRPTFTLPDAEKHPAWYSFKRDASYFNLNIENGTVDLKVIKSDDPKGRSAKGRVTYRFVPDQRLRRFRDAGKTETIRRDKFSMLYSDPLLGKDRWAEIRGIKLLFKDGEPYFVFSCDIADEPRVMLWQTVRGDDEAKPKKVKVLPEGLVTLAVDFGQKHLGAITVCRNEGGKPKQIRFMPAYFQRRVAGKPTGAWLVELPGLSFEALRAHEDEISAGMSATFGDRRSLRSGGQVRSKSRHAAKGQETFVESREHLAHMKEDRYKKAAHVILETAIQNDAKVIVIEQLRNYRPMLMRDTRENRNRMTWAVRRIGEFLKLEAEPYGIMVFQANPFGTSTFCSACGFVGARCTMPTKPDWKRFYEKKRGAVRRYVVQRGGDFFCCSNARCPRKSRMVNADVNASLNLHQRFYDQFKPVQGVEWAQVRDRVQAYLDKMSGIAVATVEEDNIPM